MNFALIMFVLLVITGAITALDRYVLSRRRAAHEREPWWIEYPKSFFPVILVVFLLRSFLVEPFKIPSGSMMPTLLVGDFILVNKYTYGIRIPVINHKVLDVHQPQRGEVVVFRYPDDPSLDYIKRLVGMPGDRVTYKNKELTINGEKIKAATDGNYSYIESGLSFVSATRYQEELGAHRHAILTQSEIPTVRLEGVMSFPNRNNCNYDESGFSCVVPPGHYFMMGDNRDSSSDSRYWGFVPDQNIVGKAFLIWWNFDELKRIGHSIE